MVCLVRCFLASAFVSLTFSQSLCINPKFLHLSVLVTQDISPASNVLRMLLKLQLHRPFPSSLQSLIHLFFTLSLSPSRLFFSLIYFICWPKLILLSLLLFHFSLSSASPNPLLCFFSEGGRHPMGINKAHIKLW